MKGERLRVLREAGQVLLEKYEGSFFNCVKRSNKSALKLLDIITKDFKCYDDTVHFKEERGDLGSFFISFKLFF